MPTPLTVDDQLSNVVGITFAMRSIECDVVIETRKDRAVARLADLHPDIVATDLTPDAADAFDLICAVKALDRSIGVIVVSGSITPQCRQKARRIGADHCFRKPLRSVLFLKAVSQLLKRRSSG